MFGEVRNSIVFYKNGCLEKSYFRLMKDKRTSFHHRCSRPVSLLLLMLMNLVQVNPNFIGIKSVIKLLKFNYKLQRNNNC